MAARTEYERGVDWNGFILFAVTNELKKKSELLECLVLILYQIQDF